MPPPRHLKLTLPRPPPSSGSSYTGSTSSSSTGALDCDVPIPSIEQVSADRTANWVVGSSGSRANSPESGPRLSGSPALSENSAPARESSESRGHSHSDSGSGSPRPLPSASPIRTASPSDGEREITREASEDSVWSTSAPPPPFRRSASGPSEPRELAPLPAPSRSGSRALYPASTGSKRTRDVEDVGAGERSPQRRCRSLSARLPSRRPSVSPAADAVDLPAPLMAPSAPGTRVLGSTRSGSKRSRDVEDVGAGERSSQRRRTASTDLPPPEPAVAPSDPDLVSVASDPAVDAAVTTDRAGAVVDLVDAPTLLPLALAVVEVINIVDIAPAVGPAAVAAVAVANPVPVPVPDRAEARARSRIDALFAKSRSLSRAERSAMYRSLESWLSREELLMDLLAGDHA
ncbi:hypothetical protein V492_05182 [Pseudogymnoascus sp. VKM F-4246]|nr:hypothetical protein V492_05182 [Pseudogymnoascus sp. VKM F-4246]